jgi:H/ACA ribonucleoprotein complex subunit 4
MKLLPSERSRTLLQRREAKTDPRYGYFPEKRPLDLHLLLGAVSLDKPPGPTSHEVVAWTKRILNIERAGHSGTLDPKVTGILPVMLGDATKIVESLLSAGKEYICLMRVHGSVPRKKVAKVCAEFEGTIYQKPPLKSSVKRQLRSREIYYLEILEIDGPRVLMKVGCEAGTYMRKLCHDIGFALGTGAHMEELRRTKSGPFAEDETLVTMHQLKDAYEMWRETGEETDLRKVVQPVEKALMHLPALFIADGAVDAVCHGAPLAAPGLLRLESDIKEGDTVGIYTLKGEVVGLAIAAMSSEEMVGATSGIVAKTSRVVMKPGTYPRRWKMRAEVV